MMTEELLAEKSFIYQVVDEVFKGGVLTDHEVEMFGWVLGLVLDSPLEEWYVEYYIRETIDYLFKEPLLRRMLKSEIPELIDRMF